MVTYIIDENTVIEYFIDRGKYPVDIEVKRKSDIVIAIEEFSIEDITRKDDKLIYISGILLVLVKAENDFKPIEYNVKIPILYDKYDKFGVLQDMESSDFEKILNSFNDETEQVGPSVKIISGEEAEELWQEYQNKKKAIAQEESNAYPDIPANIRIDLEHTLRAYTVNKVFRDRFLKLRPRFIQLVNQLVEKYPNDVALTYYKGIPVMYLKDEPAYNKGKHRLFMTPINSYTCSNANFASKIYDLRIQTLQNALTNFSRMEPRYLVRPERLPDCVQILNNLNLRKKIN